MPAELFASLAPTPLAERMRPKSLDEILGQDHLLGGSLTHQDVVDGMAVIVTLIAAEFAFRTVFKLLGRELNGAT